MLNLLAKLQRKPERVRKRIALLFASVVTGIIVLFWVISISSGGPAPVVVADEAEVGPFRALSDGLGAFVADSVAMIGSITDVFSSDSK